MVPQLVKRYMHQKSAHPLQTVQTHKCRSKFTVALKDLVTHSFQKEILHTPN